MGHGNGRTKFMETVGYRFNKDISSGSLQRFEMVEGSTMAFRDFTVCLLAACMSGRNGKRIPQNSQNPHIYLHVLKMTHGAHEVRSSPSGSCYPLPKELRINSYPPHNI